MKIISTFFLFVVFCISAKAITQTVTVQNHFFSPASFTINLGDTIKWVWVNGSHTTTSVTIPGGAASWDKNINSANITYIYVPTVAGTYNYKCTPHATMGMVASFTVTCPSVTAHIQATGVTTFCSGGSVVLVATATGGNNFQWKKNGVVVSGATASSYTAKTSGNYTLFASSNCGSSGTSNSISVTVNALPAATIIPTDTVYICPGDSIKLKANTATSLTYEWLKGGVAINGATASKYYAKQTANYKVRITKTTTGCTKLSSYTRVVTTCKESNSLVENKNFHIYPSPSNDLFNLSIENFSSEHYTVMLYDEKGSLVNSFPVNNTLTAFGNELVNGIYFVEINNGTQLVSRSKIIKMK